jgi:hypothetical protein
MRRAVCRRHESGRLDRKAARIALVMISHSEAVAKVIEEDAATAR